MRTLLLLVACTTSSPDIPPPAAQVTLKVVEETGFSSLTGNLWAYWTTVQDVRSSAPIPVGRSSYRLTTRAAVELQPEPTAVCPDGLLLSSGAQVTCPLTFAVPAQDDAALLTYRDGAGAEASLDLSDHSTPPPSSCEMFRELLQPGAGDTCVNCLDTAFRTGCASLQQAAQQTCSSPGGLGYPLCEQPCDPNSPPLMFCLCESRCQSDACTQQKGLFDDCVVSACASSCP